MSAERSSHLLDVRNGGSSDEDIPKYSGSPYTDDERYTLESYKLVPMVVKLHYLRVFSGLKSDNKSFSFYFNLLAWEWTLKEKGFS